ncbi:MAG: hypothetical protein ACPGUV_04980 [Polyangiales bacterium]
MARAKSESAGRTTGRSKAAGGGRGGTEAVEKRRVARQLNAALSGGARASTKVDGRTEKRRQRLVSSLKSGKGKNGKALKPIDVVAHVDELLGLGESIATLRKSGVKVQKVEVDDGVKALVARAQEAYSFRTEAWKILGITFADGEAVAKAPRKAPAKKAGASKGSKASKASKGSAPRTQSRRA